MNRNWDTPPDGDFVRYLEQLQAPSPGAVTRAGAQPVRAPAPPRASRPGAPAAPSGNRRPAPTTAPPAPVGPPDLAQVLREVVGLFRHRSTGGGDTRR
jgi:hypothetical protein